MKEQVIKLPFDVPLPPVIKLKAGSLHCVYEKGNLRCIKLGDTELVRMIYTAVRNSKWETAAQEITDEDIQVSEDNFFIKQTTFYNLHAIRYKATIEIKGSSDNTITFSMRGEALDPFERNRIGICMHHPVYECMGRMATVQLADGSSYKAPFPNSISPHQPFKDVQLIEWTTADDVQASILYEGDVFETEDQRNWTDSSFKTYSTPLALPFPVAVQVGDTVQQQVILKVNSFEKTNFFKTPYLTSNQKIPFPKIGYARNGDLTSAEIELFKNLPFHHYRVELYLNEPGWQATLQKASAEAAAIGTSLALVLFFTEDYMQQLETTLPLLQAIQPRIFSILVLQRQQKATPVALLHAIYGPIKVKLPQVLIGYGTDGYFAELNRNRPHRVPHDFVAYAFNPQVHASDTRSVIENLQTQHHTISTAQTFTSMPVFISPITLYNRNKIAPPLPDKRQYSSFAALWTLNTIQNVAAAAYLTLYHTTGADGLIDKKKNGYILSPIYEVLKMMHHFKPVFIIKGNKEEESPFKDFLVENKEGERLIIKADNFLFF